MDAEALKKKYNGATLRGKKIKIEDALSKKRRRTDEIADGDEKISNITENKTKKSKKDHNVLSGHELSPERKVKRGWTEKKEDKSKKPSSKRSSQSTSKFSDKEELLFRTQIPPNHAMEDDKSKKKQKKKSSGLVVHEFEKNTTQPSFLKVHTGSDSREALHYEDGKGWVDEQGNIVEAESKVSSKKRSHVTQPPMTRRVVTRQTHVDSQDIRSPPGRKKKTGDSNGDVADSNAEDGTSGDTSSSPDTSTELEQRTGLELSAPKEDSAEANEAGDKVPKEPHPLEALFKKPSKPSSHDIAKPSLEISTTFSFFDEDNNGDVEEGHIPGTPFSSQDVRMRGLRSAAPTPDTAHPSRFNSLGSTGLPGDEEIEISDDDRLQDPSRIEKEATPLEGKDKTNASVSEFEKKFWEQRGDNNRAWKERRRTVLKEKRQRENRARRPKNW